MSMDVASGGSDVCDMRMTRQMTNAAEDMHAASGVTICTGFKEKPFNFNSIETSRLNE